MIVSWLVLAACRPEPVALVGRRERGAAPITSATLSAIDVAREAGAQDWEVTGELQKGRGCTVADLDLDGLQDLVLANPGDASHVLLNRSRPGSIRFEAGPVLAQDSLVWGTAAADVDDDGDPDLFVAAGGLDGRQFDRLLMNRTVETGVLAFEDVSEVAGVLGPWRPWEPVVQIRTASVDAQWVDFDRDGDLDAWVDSTSWPRTWSPAPEGTILGQDQLWRNDGDGTFTDVAVEVGLGGQGSSRFSSWLDWDNDGDLDLYRNVMNGPSALYRNDDGRFVDVTTEASLEGGDLSMPPESFVSAPGDFNQDGWEDLMVFSRGWPSDGPYRLGHTLLLNAGGRGFVDATAPSNLNDPFLSGLRDHQGAGVMGASVRDLNGDGLPDVFLGNGSPAEGYPNGLYLTEDLVDVDLGPDAGVLAVPRYVNRSELIDRPSEPDPAAGLVWPSWPYRTHAGCVADFDRDGGPELLVMNGGMRLVAGNGAREPNQLFRFLLDPKPRWLAVSLRGDGVSVPSTPVGARIAVTARRGRATWVVRDTLRTVEGFAAQHGLERWLGLADAESIDAVEVVWPDGEVTRVEDVPLDRALRVER